MKLFGGKRYMTIVLSVIVMGSVALSVNALSKLIFSNDADPEQMTGSQASEDDDNQSGDDQDGSWAGSVSGTESAGPDLVTSSTLLPGESAAGSSGTASGSADLVSSSTTKPGGSTGSSSGTGSTSGSGVDLVTSPTINAGTTTEITVDQLKAIVEAKSPGAVITKMELGSRNGTLIYTVDLMAGTASYTMTVDATTGTVLTYTAGSAASSGDDEDDDDEDDDDEDEEDEADDD